MLRADTFLDPNLAAGTCRKLLAIKPTLQNGLVCVENRWNKSVDYRVVLQKILLNEVLQQYHWNAAPGVHLGTKRTLTRMCGQFFWSGMECVIVNYCRACEDCNRRKSPGYPPKSPICTSISSRPLEHVAIDLLPPLQVTHKANIGDYFPKWTEAYSLSNQLRGHLLMSVFVDLDNRSFYVLTRDRSLKHSSLKKSMVCWTLGRRELPRLLFGREVRLSLDVQYGLSPQTSCRSVYEEVHEYLECIA